MVLSVNPWNNITEFTYLPKLLDLLLILTVCLLKHRDIHQKTQSGSCLTIVLVSVQGKTMGKPLSALNTTCFDAKQLAATQLAGATRVAPAAIAVQQVPTHSSTYATHDHLSVLNNNPAGSKEGGSKNHYCVAAVQSQTKLTYKFSLLYRDQSRDDVLKCPLLLQTKCISLLIKKSITNHSLVLSSRSDNSKFPSGCFLGSFIMGFSYFWCLIISGGVSYAIGSHSSLCLTGRLLTAPRR